MLSLLKFLKLSNLSLIFATPSEQSTVKQGGSWFTLVGTVYFTINTRNQNTPPWSAITVELCVSTAYTKNGRQDILQVATINQFLDRKQHMKSLWEDKSLSSGIWHMSWFYNNCGHSMFSHHLIKNFMRHLS